MNQPRTSQWIILEPAKIEKTQLKWENHSYKIPIFQLEYISLFLYKN